jgi:hypothetical protein
MRSGAGTIPSYRPPLPHCVRQFKTVKIDSSKLEQLRIQTKRHAAVQNRKTDSSKLERTAQNTNQAARGSSRPSRAPVQSPEKRGTCVRQFERLRRPLLMGKAGF